jgi:hypothetical protein
LDLQEAAHGGSADRTVTFLFNDIEGPLALHDH